MSATRTTPDEARHGPHAGARAEATATRVRAEARAREAGQGRETARTAHTRAAEGLADFKQGFEELERRAAEHRVVVTRLQHARAGLPGEDVKPATLVDVTRRCDDRLHGLDVELAQLARQLAVAGEQREAFSGVHAALERLVQPEPVGDGEAHGRAEQCLADLREREAPGMSISGSSPSGRRSSLGVPVTLMIALATIACGASVTPTRIPA